MGAPAPGGKLVIPEAKEAFGILAFVTKGMVATPPPRSSAGIWSGLIMSLAVTGLPFMRLRLFCRKWDLAAGT